jgi:RNA polymerase sigma-70 factor (subfamily 1)
MGGEKESRASSELLRRAQEGDLHAFQDLLVAHRGLLEAWIHVRLGPELRRQIEVDDVFQEACLQALLSIRRFEGAEAAAFVRWMRGIAENVIRNMARHFRADKRGGGEPLLSLEGCRGDSSATAVLPASSAPSPSEVLRRAERFERLEQALASLSEDHRRVIILARLEGLPIKEIARRMERSVDAVSMLLLRALRALRTYFGSTDSCSLPAERPDALRPRDDGPTPGSDGSGPTGDSGGLDAGRRRQP